MALSRLNKCLIKLGLFCLGLFGMEELRAQSKFLKAIEPDHLKLQWAGGIGFFAFGAGYESKNQKFETDIYYGFLPESVGGEDLHSATLKFNWFPLKPIDKGKWRIKPLSVGALVNYSFGSQYYSFDPRNYPFDYYRIPTSLNTALLLGGQATYAVSAKKESRRLGFYYEILSFDREMVSFIVNTRALSLTDILTLGIGVKLAL